MPVQLKIAVDDKNVQQFFTGLIYRGQNLQPVMRDFGERMQRSIAKNFKAGGRPERWTPSKKAKGKTLIKSGRLRSSITYEVGANYLRIGTNVEYARIHQLGGVIRAKTKPYLVFQIAGQWAQKKQVNIPARPYLVFQQDDLEYLGRKLTKYLTDNR